MMKDGAIVFKIYSHENYIVLLVVKIKIKKIIQGSGVPCDLTGIISVKIVLQNQY